MFHDIKGNNVKLEQRKTTAVWCPVATGGHMFSAQPLDGNQDLNIVLNGTGRIEIGITCESPLIKGFKWPSPSVYLFLNDVKIHKRECVIVIKVEYEKKEVTSTYGRGVCTQMLRPDCKYWLAIDVKYGEVEIKMENTESSQVKYSFSKIFGENIKVENGMKIAKSLLKSPACLCIYKSPLEAGKRLQLHSTPKQNHGTVPGRYYVRLFVTDIKPEELKQLHPDRFDIKCDKSVDPRWTNIKTFEKKACHGTINLSFHNNSLKYQSPNGKSCEQAYRTRPGKDVWLVMELYGVSVSLKELLVPESQNAGNVSVDVPDASPLNPRLPSEFVHVASNVPPRLLPPILENTVGETAGQVSLATESTLTQQQEDRVLLEKGIRKNFTSLLCQLTSPQLVTDLMLEHEYINWRQFIEITESSEKNRNILRIMLKRPIKLSLLERILDKTEQMFLFEKFKNGQTKDRL